MQSSGASGDPRVLRCPHCGAPLELQPYAPLTQCRYCGHTVKLAEPAPPPVFHRPTPLVTPPHKPTASNGPLLALLGGGAMMVALIVVGAFVAAASSAPAVPPPAVNANPQSAPARAPAPRVSPKPTAEKATETRYPLKSLLGINVAVDIDGSHALMQSLFPTVTSGTHGVDLEYRVPLDHAWFGEAQLIWKNEKSGKLINVGLRPPSGDLRFKNQQQVADCLTKGLGKPEVRETDHLKGETSYFWGKFFPRAWADLYSGYFWLDLREPKGVPPITLAQALRTLDGCPATTP